MSPGDVIFLWASAGGPGDPANPDVPFTDVRIWVPPADLHDLVTWGEFVELGYLREYQRKGVPLQRLRPVIDELRREFTTPYPLATARPYILGKELVLEVQERHDLPTQIALVVSSGRQVLLADSAKQFSEKVEFDPSSPGAIQRIRPAGPASPVVIDPLVRFGRPAVSGVSTDRLWELSDAGESIEEIAAGYDLPEDEPDQCRQPSDRGSAAPRSDLRMSRRHPDRGVALKPRRSAVVRSCTSSFSSEGATSSGSTSRIVSPTSTAASRATDPSNAQERASSTTSPSPTSARSRLPLIDIAARPGNVGQSAVGTVS